MMRSPWSRCVLSAAFLLALAAAPVHADTLHTTTWIAPPPDVFTLHRDGKTDQPGIQVGGFKGTWNGVDILFWCFDLDQNFNFRTDYGDYTASTYASPQLDDIQRLFSIGFSQVFGAPHASAAFQLALWNIEYDGDADVASGSFRASGGSSTAVTLANDLLGGLHDPGVSGAGWTITRFTSLRHQDFIMGVHEPSRDVPEPAAPALALVALAAAWGARSALSTRR
jgi:hypothetical protein